MILAKIFSILFIGYIFFTPVQSQALLCLNDSLSPPEKIESSHYVFTGETIYKGDDLTYPATIKVHDVFKGNVSKEVSVDLSSDWGSLTLKTEKSYLFLFTKNSYIKDEDTFVRGDCDSNVAIPTDSTHFTEYEQNLPSKQIWNSKYTVVIAISSAAIALTLLLKKIYTKRK